MDLLSQRIELHGFQKSYDPEGDGDCFYKAAAFQLGRDENGLKNDVFDFLTENQYDPLGQNRLDFLCSDDVQNQDVPSDWNEALNLLRNSMANEMVIRALSECLHCKLTIITASGVREDAPDAYIKVIAPSEQCGTPHHELYFGHTGDHYFALTENNPSKSATEKVLPLQNIQSNEEDKEGTSTQHLTPGFDENSDEWLELFSTLLNFMLPMEYLIGEMFWWQGIAEAKQSDNLWSREHMTGSRAEGLCIPSSLLHESGDTFSEDTCTILGSDLDLMPVKKTFEIIGNEKIPIFDIIGERNDPRYVKLRLTEQWKKLNKTFDDSVFLHQPFLLSPGISTKLLNAAGLQGGDGAKIYKDEFKQDGIHGPARKLVIVEENVMSLDKTVVFEYPDAWPAFGMDWLVRPRKSGWPSPELVQDIFDSGCHLAPVGRGRRACEPVEREEYLAHPESVTNTQSQQGEESLMNDAEWRISFSLAENKLGQSLSPVQRHVMVLLKIIKKAYLSDHDVISTYLLKNILFWECENRENDFWREDNSAKCLLSMMDRLEECLRKRHVPHYIMPDSNLLHDQDQEKLDKAANTVLEVRENVFQKTVSFLKRLQVMVFQSREFVSDFSDSKRITNEETIKLMGSLCQRYKEVIADEHKNNNENAIKCEQIVATVQDFGLSMLAMMDQFLSEISFSQSSFNVIALLPMFLAFTNEIQKVKTILERIDINLSGLLNSSFWFVMHEFFVGTIEPFTRLVNSPGAEYIEYISKANAEAIKHITRYRFLILFQNMFSVLKCHFKDVINHAGNLAKLVLSNIWPLRLCVHESLLARSYCKLWFAKNGKSSEHSKDRETFTLFVRNDIKSSPLDEQFIKLSLAFFDEMIVGRDSCEVVPQTTAMERVKEIQESIARETVKVCKTFRLIMDEFAKENGILHELNEMMVSGANY